MSSNSKLFILHLVKNLTIFQPYFHCKWRKKSTVWLSTGNMRRSFSSAFWMARGIIIRGHWIFLYQLTRKGIQRQLSFIRKKHFPLCTLKGKSTLMRLMETLKWGSTQVCSMPTSIALVKDTNKQLFNWLGTPFTISAVWLVVRDRAGRGYKPQP